MTKVTTMADEYDSVADLKDVTYRVVPLHKVPQFVNECCTLINMEWKRSHISRLRSVRTSSENFPTNLVLLSPSDPEVLGHCKLTKIPSIKSAIFLETVVVHPEFRGQGLGRLLMNKTEEYVKSKKKKWIYLSTQGQEEFYAKLGYIKCDPVSIYGCSVISQFEKININQKEPDEDNKKKKQFISSQCPQVVANFHPPPPPPPPPPASVWRKLPEYTTNISSRKVFMKKEI